MNFHKKSSILIAIYKLWTPIKIEYYFPISLKLHWRQCRQRRQRSQRRQRQRRQRQQRQQLESEFAQFTLSSLQTIEIRVNVDDERWIMTAAMIMAAVHQGSASTDGRWVGEGLTDTAPYSPLTHALLIHLPLAQDLLFHLPPSADWRNWFLLDSVTEP